MDESLTIENSVLATIILQPQYQDYIEKLDELDFKEPQNKKLFRLLKLMREKNKAIDMISVSEAFKNASYITNVTECFITTATFEEHLKELKSRGIRRKLFLAAKKIAEIAEKTEDGLEAKNNALQILSEIQCDINETDDDMASMLNQTLEYIEKRYNKQDDDSYMTPFADLNQITGGLHEQELTIIAARPACGKTAIALQIAEYVAKKDITTVFISREMSKEQLGIRIFAKETNINSWNLRNGKINDEDFQKLAKVYGSLAKIKLRPNTKLSTVQEIRAYCRELKNKNNLGLLVVDYLQLIRTNGRFGSREQEVASISREFKNMALEFEIPIIVLSQLNRNAEDRRPILADLRESGALEQDADNVIFLYEPSPDEIKPDNLVKAALEIRNRGEKFMEIIVAKQRNGPEGTVYLAFEASKMRFKNIEFREG